MKTEIKSFWIQAIGQEQRSPNGYPLVECRTDLGVVAFWGSVGRRVNLDKLLSLVAPVHVRAGCRPPGPGFPSHSLWVPETAEFAAMDAAVKEPPKLGHHAPPEAEELRRWRRELADCLMKIDDAPEPGESLGHQIGRLTREGKIPRETSAMMRAVTEMRNAVEHQDKQLSASEGKAARAAWDAVHEWASSVARKGPN